MEQRFDFCDRLMKTMLELMIEIDEKGESRVGDVFENT
jgi:hypothetical protein